MLPSSVKGTYAPTSIKSAELKKEVNICYNNQQITENHCVLNPSQSEVYYI